MEVLLNGEKFETEGRRIRLVESVKVPRFHRFGRYMDRLKVRYPLVEWVAEMLKALRNMRKQIVAKESRDEVHKEDSRNDYL